MRSYLSENEAENLQNGNVHLTQIAYFGISPEPFGTLRTVMPRFLFTFFTPFHLSLTFSFNRSFPLKVIDVEGRLNSLGLKSF